MAKKKRTKAERSIQRQPQAAAQGFLGKGREGGFFLVAFFVLMGIGVIIAWALSQGLVRQARDSLAKEAVASLLPPLTAKLTPQSLASPMEGESHRQFKEWAKGLSSPTHLQEISNNQGKVVYSSDESRLGASGFPQARLDRLLKVNMETEIIKIGDEKSLRILAPVKLDGQAKGVVEIRRDYDALARLEGKYTWTLYSTILGLFLFIYLGLAVSVSRGLLTIKGL